MVPLMTVVIDDTANNHNEMNCNTMTKFTVKPLLPFETFVGDKNECTTQHNAYLNYFLVKYNMQVCIVKSKRSETLNISDSFRNIQKTMSLKNLNA